MKKNRHCNICKIFSNKRNEFFRTWKYRTFEYIQIKLVKQKKNSNEKKKNMRIHYVFNWIWNHKYCNVHKLMNFDILHQLFKNIIMRLINWCVILIKNVISNDRFKTTLLSLRLFLQPKFFSFFSSHVTVFSHWKSVEKSLKNRWKNVKKSVKNLNQFINQSTTSSFHQNSVRFELIYLSTAYQSHINSFAIDM